MSGRLEGKVAVVLGASDERSMGAAVARRFAAEGARLILAARREDAVKAVAAPLGAIGIACDITQEDSLAALAKAAVDHYGQLDVAVNLAGIEYQAPIAETTREALLQQCEVNFIGTTLFFKHMGAVLKDGGSMMTASSLTALTAPPGLGAYAGTKAGVDQLVRIAAVEYGKRGIRVNSIAPGFTRSAMTDGYFQMPTVIAAFEKAAALHRLPTVEDIANAAVWLASDEAFTTGQIIDITAGTSLRRPPDGDEMV